MASSWLITAALIPLVFAVTHENSENDLDSPRVQRNTSKRHERSKIYNTSACFDDTWKASLQVLSELPKKMNSQKKVIEDMQFKINNLTIELQLEDFRSSKDWTALRKSLKSVLPNNSQAYKELQHISPDSKEPLCDVVMNGYKVLMEVLLAGRRGVNLTDSKGCTLLIGAASSGRADLVRMLLDLGSNTEAKDNDHGKTALIIAAVRNRSKVVKTLIEHGVDINNTDQAGDTALSWAALHCHWQIVKDLVNAGANTTIRDVNNRTAFDDAKLFCKDEAVINYLEQFPHS